jgi:glucosamine--fructose-6-phosphate aminotransferase (isomerizing)
VPLNLDVIQGRYFSDLLDQPRALRATWNVLGATTVFDDIAGSLDKARFQRVVLTGMGSSYHGLHPLHIELAQHGWTSLMVETSELIHYFQHLLAPDTLVIAVSQSGKSVETVRMLEMNAKGTPPAADGGRGATVIAMTNQENSPLARQADFTVLSAAGEESTVSCKTYVAAQMGLRMLAAALCKLDSSARLRELQTAPDAVDDYLRNWKAHVDEFGEMLRDVRHLFLVGRGPSLAAVGTGALTIKESDHFHAEGMSSAAFRHGPFEMLQPGIVVGIFADPPQTRSLHDGLFRDTADTPAQAIMFSPDADRPPCRLPDVPEIARPIVEILPVQMITLALAALAGREAGKFERATKVTAVE